MYNSLIGFLKSKTTVIGIATCVMFQIIFGIVWLTGYDAVSSNLKSMGIGIVNEDSAIGKEMQKQIQNSLPFSVEPFDELQEAQKRLNNHSVKMIIYIPENTTEKISQKNNVPIEFFINESNPALVKSAMNNVAKEVTTSLNIALQKQTNPDFNEESQQLISQKINRVHSIDKFSSQMIPLMLVLAAYVGSMIMGLNIIQSFNNLTEHTLWNKFFAVFILNIITACATALAGTSIILLLNNEVSSSFLSLWGLNVICIMAFLSFAQLFLFLFGPAGMMLNIIMLSIQLVTSGAMVPRETLNTFYSHVSVFLPATYSVEGYYNILFGGGPILGNIYCLLLITIFSILISSIRIGAQSFKLKRENKQKNIQIQEA